MKWRVRALVLSGLAIPAFTFAEGGCPTGMTPYQGSNVASCGPIPVSGDTWAAEPQWADRWGAIAGDAGRGVAGAAVERPRKHDAEKDAIAACRARGGVRCVIEVTYANQCVVTIRWATGTQHVRAVSIDSATESGLALCRQRGDRGCRVRYQACSFPARIR
ncbi:DUF4189 domain-containing protein [Lysobacter sp. BMK333-48F3]|uniref:DUF4189 domain-containing protein n=1 Tax=Lysobacter sp. BMK333-48F3 TaxID=2867962 RepID=UPI001C8B4CE8|nr:DUF4189 domain-containing protein [Lysobacter sp. BMK333-48F3]MBX9401730.1 DUF4189 domain-containing protein [Lysobacter sp. BMK333-48F3]